MVFKVRFQQLRLYLISLIKNKIKIIVIKLINYIFFMKKLELFLIILKQCIVKRLYQLYLLNQEKMIKKTEQIKW